MSHRYLPVIMGYSPELYILTNKKREVWFRFTDAQKQHGDMNKSVESEAMSQLCDLGQVT